MEVFSNYEDALIYARKTAKEFSIDIGIEKRKEFGRIVFSVKILPRPENCYGHELRMERVKPTD